MIFLVLSIICSTALVVIFKYFDRFSVNFFDAIIVNYLVCGLIGLVILGDPGSLADAVKEPFFVHTLILGTLFMIIFNVIALSTQKVGITVTAVSQKISFIIPVTAAWIAWNEDINAAKIGGLVLAMASIYFLSFRREKGTVAGRSEILIPLIVFFGSGTCDLYVKVLQSTRLDAENFHLFTTLVFLTAFSVGLLSRLAGFPARKRPLNIRSLYGGILLGIPNYASLIFLIYALEFAPLESSVIFPLNNVSIVLLSALSGWLLFVERFQPAKRIGLVLAVSSILIMGFLA